MLTTKVKSLPRLELTNLVIEVDGWTQFSKHLTHPKGRKCALSSHSGGEPRQPEALKYLDNQKL